MTIFYNFALKIETNWSKKVVKLILETWNANDVITYVWFDYNNFKCTKFTMKN